MGLEYRLGMGDDKKRKGYIAVKAKGSDDSSPNISDPSKGLDEALKG